MRRFVHRARDVDWAGMRRRGHNTFTKLIRTRDPRDTGDQELPLPGRQRLSRCLSTLDLTSLGVGSCVGTGMYLVAGIVAHNYAGPGVAISFIIAAMASIFSGACYAEFGVRVPNTTGSAYSYAYVTVGEFIAFVIGWNMILEYMIGTSACARALSACIDSLLGGAISSYVAKNVGTVFGKPPDVLAFVICILMTMVLVAGVKKSLVFNNLLNAINMIVWVFLVGAGAFYIDTNNWTGPSGFLPYGWSGVFTGAATCFYAFIGFDIIATTGEEANNPKRSIPLAIVCSLGIILLAYVSTSIILTLVVPYKQVDTGSALVQMFAYVDAPTCKYVVAIGALAGLTVSMFGSMFPMPRIMYAMANDGLIFKRLAAISESTGSPALATVCSGVISAFVAMFVQLEVLVEMMSIGTLLAYSLVSACVLVLRFQPYTTNLIELLPQRLRTPVDPEGTASAQRETSFASQGTHMMPPGQRVMVRRVTRSSPDSDDTLPGDESEEYGRDDAFLMNPNNENKFYGAMPGGCAGNTSLYSRFIDALYRRIQPLSYLFPGLFPWVHPGPPTVESGMYVLRCFSVMFVCMLSFDLLAAYADPTNTVIAVIMGILLFAIFVLLLLISRQPQNRVGLLYATPGVPYVPAMALLINMYLIFNLSLLTLLRFTIWMFFGMIMYFQYGIYNSTLETNPPQPRARTPPPPNPFDRTTIPPAPAAQPRPDRNIFEGDGLFGQDQFSDPLLAWHVADLEPVQSTSRGANNSGFVQVETRYDARTNRTTSHASIRPPWAYPDSTYDTWDD
ncbi:solute carrier family 7 member 14 [Epargyreus clarus]|uniref:solute carrier family 7 member 14 n=1 Tax=Epargyreus clarus TaxID=520877 RepID=UPI003C2E8492